MRQVLFFISLTIIFLFSAGAMSDASPTIDGDLSDWPQDAWTYADADDLDFLWGLLEHRDIVNVWVTDDNADDPADPSNGNLYLALEVTGTFDPNFLGADIDFFLNLDTNLDGATDVTLELTDDLIPVGGDFDYQGSFAEFAIPYSALGLDYLNDTFGVSVTTAGLIDTNDLTPEPGEGDDGYIIYNGQDDDVEPLSVRMLAHWAVALNGGGVLLSWKTGAERHNAGFRLYKKTGRGWRLLNDVPIPGLGNSAFGRGYSFFDDDGRIGDRYRIDDVDYTGKATAHSIMVATDESFFMKGMTTWRTPGSGALWQQKQTASIKERMQTLFGAAAQSKRIFGNRQLAVGTEVDTHGLQFVSYEDIRFALGHASLARGRIRVKTNGRNVATLQGNDGIYFLGVVPGSRYADTQTYVISKGRSFKMGRKRVSQAGCHTPVRQHEDIHVFVENNLYNITAPSGDPFQWAMAFVGVPAQLNIILDSTPEGESTLSVTVAGLAEVAGPDHGAFVLLNGVPLGTYEWEGRDKTQLRAAVPEGLLKVGDNTVKVGIQRDDVTDILWVENVSVSAPRKLLAHPDGLRFDAPAGRCIEIGGLVPQSDYRLFDVTNSDAPVELVGFHVKEDGATVFNPGSRGRGRGTSTVRKLLLVSLSDAHHPAIGDAFALDSPLKGRRNRADYLIITHPLFVEAADHMAAFHSEQGREVKIVTTDEIYDGFNHGNKHPSAIKALIDTAHTTWQKAPGHVLLIGAATVDPLGFLGLGDEDFVPAPFYKTLNDSYEAASDGYYIDGHTGVSIGRLPVETVAEANGVVAKITGYDAGASGKNLFIADWDGAGTGESNGFQAAATMQIETSGSNVESTVALFRDTAFDAVRDFTDAVTGGVDVVNFNGHAYLSGWSSGPELATVESALALDNEKLFVLLSWSCFDGAFTGPWDASLAWAFVGNPKGGAVAAVASSSLSQPASVDLLSRAVNYQLTSGMAQTIGEALYNAKQQVAEVPGISSADVVATFNLLGDPATPNPWL